MRLTIADPGGPVRVALRLTALALLLRPMGPDVVRAALLAIAASALIVPSLLTRPALWYAAAALVTIRIGADWPLADNHIYLLAYWCLAAALALGMPDPSRRLATSVKWLIGLAFLMAVIWKGVLSPDYRDGRLFRVTLITDVRMTGAARLLGGLTAAELAANRDALAPLPEGAELLDPPELTEPPAFRALVYALTWGGLLLELLVAIAFLAPVGARFETLRHVLLLAFCALTYMLVPVAGFCWVLVAMGVATLPPDSDRLRAAYVVVWLGVLLAAEVPWSAWLADGLIA